MYAWYSKSTVCFAYLDDVPDIWAFTQTLWKTRGWTLQELLAPSKMKFYTVDWNCLGTKESLSNRLSQMTGIDEDFLTNKRPLESANIAKRMSWAARRKTSRPEDIAYCLMGIFSINMPMLYGEGDKAFLRLQEEIMKISDDHSLFVWTDPDASDDTCHGMLARHPSYFRHLDNIISYHDWEIENSNPFSMSNRGLRIELALTPLKESDLYAAALNCSELPLCKDYICILLVKLPGGYSQYARTRVNRLGEIQTRAALQTIYVRQKVVLPDIEGHYPHHFVQLRRFTSSSSVYQYQYQSCEVLSFTGLEDQPILWKWITRNTHHWISSRQKIFGLKHTWLGNDWVCTDQKCNRNDMPCVPPTCKIINRGEKDLCFVIRVKYERTKEVPEFFHILIGSMAGHQVGFTAVVNFPMEKDGTFNLVHLNEPFELSRAGSSMGVGNHRVHMETEIQVKGPSKYYMVDVDVNNV